MKKILTLLSAVSLTATATASASVVACGRGNDNGGGTVEPPTSNVYKLDEIFVEKNIDEISVNYSESGAWMQTLYSKMIDGIIVKNYSNKDSKIGQVGKMQEMKSALAANLGEYYSSKGINDNFDNLIKLSEGLEVGENTISNFEFKADFIHSDIIKANEGKDSEKASKEIIKKMQEGTVTIFVKNLKINKR